MHRNEEILAKITDRAIKRLINEPVVMPSTYLETFIRERQSAAQPPETAEAQSVSAYRAVEDALFGSEGKRDAVLNELDLLRAQLFSDDVTAAKNRLWLYKEKLDARQCFKEEGILAGIRITAFEAIASEYDAVVGDRLQNMVCDYVTGYFNLHHVSHEIARLSPGYFLLFTTGTDAPELGEHLANMQNGVGSYTFKHRNRLFGLAFDAVETGYSKREPFASVMDRLEEKRFSEGIVGGGTAGRT